MSLVMFSHSCMFFSFLALRRALINTLLVELIVQFSSIWMDAPPGQEPRLFSPLCILTTSYRAWYTVYA